jgi:ribonuclease HI
MENVLKIFCDGGARGNPGPAAAAFVVIDNHKIVFKDSKYLGKTTNNKAEYQAVVMAMQWLVRNKETFEKRIVHFILDSQLVAKQLAGSFKVKDESLRNFYWTVKDLEKKTELKIFYECVRRSENKLSDSLVNKKLNENN